MDILEVLERFDKMSQSEKAWIMTTLIDFSQHNRKAFDNEYGTYVRSLIIKLITGS